MVMNTQSGSAEWDDDERGSCVKMGTTRTSIAPIPDDVHYSHGCWDEIPHGGHSTAVCDTDTSFSRGGLLWEAEEHDPDYMDEHEEPHDDEYDGNGDADPSDGQLLEDAPEDVRFYKFMYT